MRAFTECTLAPLFKDMYKAYHHKAYHPEVTHVYSNFTNRHGKYSNTGMDEVVFVGLQYVILEYLVSHWKDCFFDLDKREVVLEYKRVIGSALGKEVSTEHLEALHDLGYLPLHIKALPEGTLVPYGVPCFTITNTVEGFGWLVNMLETMVSSEVWGISTSATTAYAYRKAFEDVAEETGLDRNMIPFLGHDFSYRGCFGSAAAAMSGFGHLTSFVGSDTIPAAIFAEQYYFASINKDLVFASVDATEHSVMCSYGTEGEQGSLEHIITNVTPTGIVSIVSDTWDFWKLVTEYLPNLKDVIMAREGTVVIRPDSGDPVDILCGTDVDDSPEGKGLIECLWNIFGGTVNKQGYKQLDPHIGAIYGDSITLERQEKIIKKLMAKGFVPHVVLGIGSYTYQYVTRDTHGSAVKATCVQKGEGNYEAIFKDPKTDKSKKSAKGLLKVDRDKDGNIVLFNDVTPKQEKEGLLKTVFIDGENMTITSLEEIRKNLWG